MEGAFEKSRLKGADMKLQAIIAMVAALFIVAGCGGGKEGGGSDSAKGGAPAVKKEGFDSPKALVTEMMELQKKTDNIDDFLVFFSPDQRKNMAFQMYIVAGMMVSMGNAGNKEENQKTLKDIQARYKIPEKIEGADGALQDKAKAEELANKVFKDVDNLAFLKDIFKLMAVFDKSTAKMPKVKEVKDYKEEGEKASAKMIMEGDDEKDINFVKVNGRWFMVFPSGAR
jgi:hypothetical protein